nr:unnamed protein product [Callosobruchus chinensis]
MLRNTSSRSARRPRPHVAETVVIASTSGVILNKTDATEVESDTVESESVQLRNKDMVAEVIRSSKDIPKLRNRIFEESLESQEVSFYIDEDSEPYYDNIDLRYQCDNYDTFDDSESDSDIYEDHAVISSQNIEDRPLPEPPPQGPNQFEKFAKNIRIFKKNISKDIGKSLRRISQRVSQKYTEDELQKVQSPPIRPPRVEQPATVSNVIFGQERQEEEGPIYENAHTHPGLFNLIRRSMSLSQESAMNLTSKIGPKTTRRSTFYITEAFDADGDPKTDNSESSADRSDRDSISLSSTRTKITRPRSPPPPAPLQSNDKPTSRLSTTRKQPDKTKSLYTEAGLFKSNHIRPRSSTSWYSDAGLYSNSSDSSSSSETNVKRFADVISELNSKLSGSSDKNHNTAKDQNHNEGTNETDYAEAVNESVRKNQTVLSADSDRENDLYTETESAYYADTSVSSLDSKNDDSSVTYSKSGSKFLEYEPLYQFYDASLLEASYYDDMAEFEADIYEDIGTHQNNEDDGTYAPKTPIKEIMSSNNQSTFAFTRSLWCEVPEVANSVVLSQLSSQQKKLQEAKFEIITSEASYLNSLNVLNDHFASQLRSSNIVNEKDMEILFGKVRKVRNCSKRVLHDLEKCWKGNILLDGICDIIQKHAEGNFDAYIAYCENQVIIGETLNALKKKPEFSDLLIKLESSSSCQFLSLYSFLMLPMQRITRWPLLVDAVLKRLSPADPEYVSCQYALASVNKVVSQCNEAARQKDRQLEMEKIANTLEFSKTAPPINIVKENRWLLRSGTVTCFQPRSEDTRMTFGKRFTKFTLYLYLFNDLLLVTKKKNDQSFAVIHYCPRNFVELRDVDMFPVILKKEAQDKNVLYLSILENQEGKIVELLLSCSSESEKERWIEAFSPPRSDNPEETVYECWDCPQVTAIHNYAPCQPDELALSRGDVINVLRKMTDGWYNGERIRDGQTGWFPSNYTVEIANPHVRARNLKQRYRLLTFSEHYLNS